VTILQPDFFDRDAGVVARSLLGKVIRHNYKGKWLAARIIETEAYYLDEKGSHASLGYTEKRKALFMPAGTIYMYYARGKDSLNVSCRGKGNAVLIKSAFPFEDRATHPRAIAIMQSLNPSASGELRPLEKLCSGQTLLCQAMAIKVSDWDQQQFDRQRFYFDDAAASRTELSKRRAWAYPRDATNICITGLSIMILPVIAPAIRSASATGRKAVTTGFERCDKVKSRIACVKAKTLNHIKPSSLSCLEVLLRLDFLKLVYSLHVFRTQYLSVTHRRYIAYLIWHRGT